MEARQNEIKPLPESVLQCGSLGGWEGRSQFAINGKRLELSLIYLVWAFYHISMHEKKMHQNSHVRYSLTTQEITGSQQINLAVYLPRAWKTL